MSNGPSSEVPVTPQDLPLPLANPRECDPNIELPLEKFAPYVVAGCVRVLEFNIHILSSPASDYAIVIGTFDAAGCLIKTSRDESSPEIQVATSWDAATQRNSVSATIDLDKLPRAVVYIVVAAVSKANFAQDKNNRMELVVRGFVSDTQNYQVRLNPSRDLLPRVLGKRTLHRLQGTAYSIAALARFGAWWHLYPLRASSPGVHTPDQLRQAWQSPHMSRFLERCGFGAHQPQRKWVSISVAEGRNLAPKNLNLLGRRVHSDPYVKTQCNGTVEEYVTKTKTLNPVWEVAERVPHTLCGVTESDARVFVVLVFDHENISSDKFMGWCYVPISFVSTLSAGEHALCMSLSPVDRANLERLRLEGVDEWRRFDTTSVRGYVRIVISVRLEGDR